MKTDMQRSKRVAPFRLRVSVRNNRMMRRREEIGYRTVSAFARAFGFHQTSIGRLEALKVYPVKVSRARDRQCSAVACFGPAKSFKSPWCNDHREEFRDGWVDLELKPGAWLEWTSLAKKVAFRLGTDEEWLWPSEALAIRRTSASMEAEASQLMQVHDAVTGGVDARHSVIAAAIESLDSPREEMVLRYRFGLDSGAEQTLGQVANVLGIASVERVRQIEAKALRKLRHPSRVDSMRRGDAVTSVKPLVRVAGMDPTAYKVVPTYQAGYGAASATRMVQLTMTCGHTDFVNHAVRTPTMWPCAKCSRVPVSDIDSSAVQLITDKPCQ